MATLGELTTEVAEEIGSIDATADQVKIWRFLNRGVRDFLRRTHCYVQSETFTPGANLNYTLDATVLAVVDAYFTNATTSLERVTVAEIHRMRRANTASSSYPRFYAFQNPLVLFNVAPAAADTLTVVNVPVPTAATNSSHDLADATYGGIPADYHDAVAYFAEWHIASFDDDASSSQGARYKEWYEGRVGACIKEMRLKGGRRTARASVGSSRRGYWPADRSADW
jgi:hypothetical protein